jgi:PAS domain S-box-containing protein
MQPCPFSASDCPDESCPHQLERLTYALAHREEQLLGFWKNSRDIQAIFSRTGLFEMVSPSCLPQLGYTPEQMVGHPFLEFVHPDDVHRTSQMFKAMHANTMPAVEFKNRYRHADGHYVHMEWNTSPPVEGRLYATARVGARVAPHARTSSHVPAEPATINGRSRTT